MDDVNILVRTHDFDAKTLAVCNRGACCVTARPHSKQALLPFINTVVLVTRESSKSFFQTAQFSRSFLQELPDMFKCLLKTEGTRKFS